MTREFKEFEEFNRLAVDAVAARMTSGSAPADLRARVLARLDTPPAWLALWRPSLAIAVVLVAVGAGWMRYEFTSTRSVEPSVSTQPASASRVTPDARSTTQNDALPAPRPRTPRRPKGPTATEVAWSERAVAALAPVDPLSIEAIQPTPLSIPQLDVKPIALPIDANGGDGKGRP